MRVDNFMYLIEVCPRKTILCEKNVGPHNSFDLCVKTLAITNGYSFSLNNVLLGLKYAHFHIFVSIECLLPTTADSYE